MNEETLDLGITNDKNLDISNSDRENILAIGKWSNFIGIVGLIISSIYGIISLFSLVGLFYGGLQAIVSFLLLISFVIFGFVLSLTLSSINSKGKAYVKQNSKISFRHWLADLHKYFKMIGIYLIVMLSLLVLLLLIAIGSGMMLSRMY